jgi:hypothetical protein
VTTRIDLTELTMGPWLLSASPSGRSASHQDGTGFCCDRVHGLTATTRQISVLPPVIALWLIGPLLEADK